MIFLIIQLFLLLSILFSIYNKYKLHDWNFTMNHYIKFFFSYSVCDNDDKQPFLIGTNYKDARQRSRFIWSNIAVHQKNLVRYQKSNIFLRQLQHDDEDLINYGNFYIFLTLLYFI